MLVEHRPYFVAHQTIQINLYHFYALCHDRNFTIMQHHHFTTSITNFNHQSPTAAQSLSSLDTHPYTNKMKVFGSILIVFATILPCSLAKVGDDRLPLTSLISFSSCSQYISLNTWNVLTPLTSPGIQIDSLNVLVDIHFEPRALFCCRNV